MKNSLEKLYYKKTSKEFNKILDNLKNNIDTIHFLNIQKHLIFIYTIM